MKKSTIYKIGKFELFSIVAFLGIVLGTIFHIFPGDNAFAASDATLSLVTTPQTVNIGDTVTLVAVEDPGTNANVRAVDIFIQFDSAVLRLDSITNNAVAFPVEMANNIPPATAAGTANFGTARLTGAPLVGAQNVATFSFTALAPGANSAITFTSGTAIWDSGVDVTAVGGLTGAVVTVNDVLGATIPTILSVSSDTVAGSYNLNDIIDIDVTFSEPVTSTEAITVTLETGGTDRVCTIPLFLVASATATCDYTVQAGDTSSDLGLIAGTAPIATSGTIEDAVGDAVVDFVPATTLAANEALVIDTTAPAILETTPVTTPTIDPTPNYVFSSDEAGTIVYGGSCATGNESAVSGSNTATFGTLTDGTYADCTIQVRDTALNFSNTLAVPSFTVDATAPTGGDFMINNDDASTNSASVTLNVTCPTDSWGTVQMAFGNTAAPTNWTNCLASTAHTLSAGDGTKTVYMRFQDGGTNATSDITDTISMDTGAPTVTQVTAVPSPTNDTTPNYTFNTDEAGDISYAGDCDSTDATATSGNNTITFDATPLGAGAHTNCTITVTDALLNASTPLDVNDFTIDLTDPVISEVTAVATPTIDNSPDYTFTTSEAGDITYGGDCDSTDDSATSGSNTITFDAMPDGDYTNCTIIVTDAATNASNTLDVTDFTVDAGVPFLSDGSPSGELNDGTTTATLAVTTSENATCKFGTVAGTAYASIANTFTTTGGTSHSEALTGLTDDTSYNYYVRCEDVNTNANVIDYTISFSVDKHEDKKKEVVKPRRIGNTPKTVARGKILIDYGKKFSKNADVALYFTKSDGTYYPPRIVRTNSKGSFSLAYLVPMSKMTGKYKWYAVDLNTGWKSPKYTYRVK